MSHIGRKVSESGSCSGAQAADGRPGRRASLRIRSRPYAGFVAGGTRKGAAKREEIVRVALDVFAAVGDEGASLREVARRCGTSTAGILYYFSSKEELLVEVLRSRDTLPPEDPSAPSSPYGKGLDADGETYHESVRHNMSNPGLVALFVAMASRARDAGHPASAFFVERYERLRRTFTGYTRRYGLTPKGGLTHEQAAVIAISLIDGVQLQWLADESIDMVSVIDAGMRGLYDLPAPTGSDTAAPSPDA